MLTVYNEASFESRPKAIEIAVELVTDASRSRRFPLIELHQVAGTIDGDSRFLGYDVADESLISGLSNCRYSVDELNALRADCAGKLNHVGLFGTLEAADLFRTITDSRVPEHAPFWIFALHRL
jgi:hypothetical protein